MVAPQLVDNEPQSAPSSPPPATPPPRRFRRGLLAAVAALAIAGARQIQVTFSDGQTVNATLVGSNTTADLAVIRVSVAASSLHPVTLGNSDSVGVGDAVYAIGSPFGLSGSFSQGIISNLKQSGATSNGDNLSSLIQTDAAI